MSKDARVRLGHMNKCRIFHNINLGVVGWYDGAG